MKWDDLHVKAVFSAAEDGEDLRVAHGEFCPSIWIPFQCRNWICAVKMSHGRHYKTLPECWALQDGFKRTKNTVESNYGNKVIIRSHEFSSLERDCTPTCIEKRVKHPFLQVYCKWDTMAAQVNVTVTQQQKHRINVK